MSDAIKNQREYYKEISALAKQIAEEVEGDTDRASDLAHEIMDGHQWIIYTYYNLQVLEHSRNESAYFENCGSLDADSYCDAMAKMAFAAMLQDVYEELQDACEAWLEEHSNE